jgi:hypothetical protein
MSARTEWISADRLRRGPRAGGTSAGGDEPWEMS